MFEHTLAVINRETAHQSYFTIGSDHGISLSLLAHLKLHPFWHHLDHLIRHENTQHTHSSSAKVHAPSELVIYPQPNKAQELLETIMCIFLHPEEYLS